MTARPISSHVLNLKCCIADFLLCFSDFLLTGFRRFRDLVLVVLIARHNVAPFNCKEPIRCLAFFAQARLTHKYAYQSPSLMHRGPWAALNTTLAFKEIKNGRSRREDYPCRKRLLDQALSMLHARREITHQRSFLSQRWAV